ncbi:nuclear transport factor 2 family protein [Sphingobacterium sp. SGR-19]|uniref:nuclear transport factor 2 family protein n=1 Tax=Sphingobacterium sp. SGR-19 TaxID=2710886 RepID=UPI0013EB78E9|nr:nuclear transport factor 2 family protein [Sphingobacterium sp. SGR-19]NGM66879.1 nuclear transport factor 2 family protein [Sphingobacterium sp. SGR-19]
MVTKNEILSLENKLYEAMKNRNTEVLDNLLHADLLFVIPNGQVITKEMDLQTYREGNLKLNEIIPSVEELNIIDDLAIITLQMELKGSYNNEFFEANYRYIRFWKKFPEGIKVVGGSGIAI